MLNVEKDGSVLHVTLNRPEVRNAFNDELIAELSTTFSSLDPSVRVVVVSGEGKVFSAGGDLNWMRKAADYTEDQNYEDALKLFKLFESMTTCSAVVVSKIHGAAFGGGCGLVSTSDVAIAQTGTKFSFSEVRLGLIPATISTFVIPKIGHGHARHLFTTGEVFETEHAQRIGLVHKVADEETINSVVDGVLADVLRNGPQAVAESKRTAVEGPFSGEVASRLLAKARSGEEGKEGVAAFLDKRKASFVEER